MPCYAILIWLLKAWSPAGSAPHMSTSGKRNFAWQTYSLNLTLYPLGRKPSIHSGPWLWCLVSVIKQFRQLFSVPLFLYMCVSLITLEALANFSDSWQEGKDLRDSNFLKVWIKQLYVEERPFQRVHWEKNSVLLRHQTEQVNIPAVGNAPVSLCPL